MSTLEKLLMQKQMDELIRSFSTGKGLVHPHAGWIQSIRLSLGMSLRQLAIRLKLAANTVKNFEKREQLGTITIDSLKKVADAMGMDVVYYFIPRNGSIEKTVEHQAKLKAISIVRRSSQTMKLEDQETSLKSREREVSRITKEITQKMPTSLWE